MVSVLLAAALAYVAGAFTPAVGRKIKALFVKEGAAVKSGVLVDIKKVEGKL